MSETKCTYHLFPNASEFTISSILSKKFKTMEDILRPFEVYPNKCPQGHIIFAKDTGHMVCSGGEHHECESVQKTLDKCDCKPPTSISQVRNPHTYPTFPGSKTNYDAWIASLK